MYRMRVMEQWANSPKPPLDYRLLLKNHWAVTLDTMTIPFKMTTQRNATQTQQPPNKSTDTHGATNHFHGNRKVTNLLLWLFRQISNGWRCWLWLLALSNAFMRNSLAPKRFYELVGIPMTIFIERMYVTHFFFTNECKFNFRKCSHWDEKIYFFLKWNLFVQSPNLIANWTVLFSRYFWQYFRSEWT